MKAAREDKVEADILEEEEVREEAEEVLSAESLPQDLNELSFSPLLLRWVDTELMSQ